MKYMLNRSMVIKMMIEKKKKKKSVFFIVMNDDGEIDVSYQLMCVINYYYYTIYNYNNNK